MPVHGVVGRLPPAVRPMLASSGPVPFGPGWAYELKWDGVRAIVGSAGDQVRLTSRNGNDVTAGYPELTSTGLSGGRPVLLDGEVVALDRDGRPDFGLLQQRMHVRQPSAALRARVPVALYVFDVLEVDGRRLLSEPYDRRRERLGTLGLEATTGVAVPPFFVDVDGGQMLEIARAHRLEGVVAKRRASRYEPGRRSSSWVKTALLTNRETVVGGWTSGEGRRAATFGALLLGAYDERHRLRFLGHVGTGFTEAMLRHIRAELEPFRRRSSPFDEPVPREYARRAHWVEPRLVGEVRYRVLTRNESTGERRLRHASWRGLRPDKVPDEVVWGSDFSSEL